GISDVEFDGSALLNEPIEIIDGVTFETKPASSQAKIHLTYKNNSFGFDLKGAIKLGDNFPEGLRNEYLEIESLRMNSHWEIIEFKARASDLDGIVLPGDFIIENGLLAINYDYTVQGGPIFIVGGNIILPSAVTNLFGSDFEYDIFASAEISATEGLRNLKFDATGIEASIIDTFQLNQGMFKGRYNQNDGISLVCSGGISVSANSPLPEELKSAQLALSLEYTSHSGLKQFSVGLAPGSSAITLHPAGIKELDFGIDEFSVDVTTEYYNAVPRWTSQFQFGGNLKFSEDARVTTLPEEIRRLQLDTDFSLTIRDSEIIASEFSADCNAHFSMDMFGL
ncbi:MAG: hypothetical protein JXO44_12140, partial [Clostridia bacterium]|nr:hypothetical protein [Clostridia bacterium]